MKVKSYKDLNVWTKGIEIVDLVYDLALDFPNTERYGLASQMQRSAVSIPSNIAEGFLRQTTKEYKQYLYISLGSCGELDTQTIIAERRNYLSKKEYSIIKELLDHEMKMLRNLIKSLTKH